MNAIKECAIKRGKLCRVEQIFTSWNTDVHGLHVPTIEHLMVKAFDDGGLEDVRLLLNQGASVSAFPRGRPVFHESVDQEQENLPLVQLLLAHLKAGKHNINIVDRNGESALHLAAHNGHWAVSEMLLEAGMKADIPNKKGETPLSLAGQNFDTSMMRTLLEGGANPNVVPAAGNPLLHELIDRAQVSGNFKSLEFLLGWQDEDRSLDYRLVDAEGIAPHQVLVGNCPYSNEVWLRLREKAGNIDLPAPRTVEGFECSLQIRGDY